MLFPSRIGRPPALPPRLCDPPAATTSRTRRDPHLIALRDRFRRVGDDARVRRQSAGNLDFRPIVTRDMHLVKVNAVVRAHQRHLHRCDRETAERSPAASPHSDRAATGNALARRSPASTAVGVIGHQLDQQRARLGVDRVRGRVDRRFESAVGIFGHVELRPSCRPSAPLHSFPGART